MAETRVVASLSGDVKRVKKKCCKHLRQEPLEGSGTCFFRIAWNLESTEMLFFALLCFFALLLHFNAVFLHFFVLRSILDAHAPSRQRTIIVRPKAPWYTSEIDTQKKLRRKFERLWRCTKSQLHRREYQQQCRVVNDLLYASKQAYYHAKIKDNSHNQKFLFSTINKLLQKNTDRLYPNSTDDGTLANAFADFFAEKISKIRTAILETKSNLSVNFLAPVPCSARFSSSNEVDCSAVHKLLSSLSKKSCSLDPVPACVLMECSDTLLPIFTKIINLSLTHGVMPDSLKTAILSPLLYSQIFAQYRT